MKLTKTQIKTLLKEHGTIVAAAAAAGVSRITFTAWMRKCDIETPKRGIKSKAPSRERLVKVLNKTGSQEGAAEVFNVTRAAVAKWQRQMDIKQAWV